MAALQLTYGGSSYNITALHIIDANIADNTFLQGVGNFIKDNVTALNVVDANIADNTFLQGAGNFIEHNVTALNVVDANIADNIFLRGGVSSQFAEATGATADPESWE